MALKNPCILNTNVVVRVNKDILVFNGQGEGETKWKGCAWKLLRIKLLINKFFFVI